MLRSELRDHLEDHGCTYEESLRLRRYLSQLLIECSDELDEFGLSIKGHELLV